MGDAYGHMDEAHGGPFGGRLDDAERFRMEQVWLEEDLANE